MGFSPWGHKESDMTEQPTLLDFHKQIDIFNRVISLIHCILLDNLRLKMTHFPHICIYVLPPYKNDNKIIEF